MFFHEKRFSKCPKNLFTVRSTSGWKLSLIMSSWMRETFCSVLVASDANLSEWLFWSEFDRKWNRKHVYLRICTLKKAFSLHLHIIRDSYALPFTSLDVKSHQMAAWLLWLPIAFNMFVCTGEKCQREPNHDSIHSDANWTKALDHMVWLSDKMT